MPEICQDITTVYCYQCCNKYCNVCSSLRRNKHSSRSGHRLISLSKRETSVKETSVRSQVCKFLCFIVHTNCMPFLSNRSATCTHFRNCIKTFWGYWIKPVAAENIICISRREGCISCTAHRIREKPLFPAITICQQ